MRTTRALYETARANDFEPTDITVHIPYDYWYRDLLPDMPPVEMNKVFHSEEYQKEFHMRGIRVVRRDRNDG